MFPAPPGAPAGSCRPTRPGSTRARTCPSSPRPHRPSTPPSSGSSSRGDIVRLRIEERKMSTVTDNKARDWSAPNHDAELIHYSLEGRVAVIEMDDPPANTYTYAF